MFAGLTRAANIACTAVHCKHRLLASTAIDQSSARDTYSNTQLLPGDEKISNLCEGYAIGALNVTKLKKYKCIDKCI